MDTLANIILIGLFFGGTSIALDHKWGFKDYFDQRRANAKRFKKFCFFCIFFWASVFIIFPVEFFGQKGNITVGTSIIALFRSGFYALCAAYCGSLFQSIFNYFNS